MAICRSYFNLLTQVNKLKNCVVAPRCSRSNSEPFSGYYFPKTYLFSIWNHPKLRITESLYTLNQSRYPPPHFYTRFRECSLFMWGGGGGRKVSPPLRGGGVMKVLSVVRGGGGHESFTPPPVGSVVTLYADIYGPHFMNRPARTHQ